MSRRIEIRRYNMSRPDGTIKLELKSSDKTVISDIKNGRFSACYSVIFNRLMRLKLQSAVGTAHIVAADFNPPNHVTYY